jgi:hypothetical protein
VLAVELWAEIRRLHRAERMPTKADHADAGDLEEHGAVGSGERRAAEIPAQVGPSAIRSLHLGPLSRRPAGRPPRQRMSDREGVQSS